MADINIGQFSEAFNNKADIDLQNITSEGWNTVQEKIDASGGEGGDTITAVNKTGASILNNQKVWINKNDIEEGITFSPTNTQHKVNAGACISSNGNYFSYSINNTTARKLQPLWYINNLNEGTVTSLGSSLIYFSDNIFKIMYSNNNDTFLCLTQNSSSSRGWSKIGDNTFNWTTNNYYLGYDLVASNGTTASAESIKILNMNNGELTPVNTSIKGLGEYSIATSSTDIYSFSTNSNYRRHYIIDRNNLTIASSTPSQNNITCQYPIGATSDGKVVIAVNKEPSMLTVSGCNTLQFIKILGDTETAYLIDEYPEDLKTIVNNSDNNYCFCFNPNCNVLTYAKISGSANDIDYGFYQYSTTTESWTKLNIDLTDAIGNGYWLYGVITVTSDLSRVGINVSNTADYGLFRIIQLTSTSGYKLVPYKYYSIGEDIITGIAKENIASNSSGLVETILGEA